jgi:hypothetical protein
VFYVLFWLALLEELVDRQYNIERQGNKRLDKDGEKEDGSEQLPHNTLL